MIIYFRCTSKPETVSGVDRWMDCIKDELVLKCWMSLQLAAVPKDDTFIVIHDELNSEALDFIKETRTCSTEFIEVEPHEIENRGHTFKLLDVLEENLEKDISDKIHYIVEDDYLHTKESLNLCKEILGKGLWEHFVAPYDYPDRYSLDKQSCGLMVGPRCHWRTNPSATYTLMARAEIWKGAMPLMREHAPHNFTEEVFKLYPCISPIPGVASHLTQHHMTPLVDWRAIWNQL